MQYIGQYNISFADLLPELITSLGMAAAFMIPLFALVAGLIIAKIFIPMMFTIVKLPIAAITNSKNPLAAGGRKFGGLSNARPGGIRNSKPMNNTLEVNKNEQNE